MNEVLIFFIFYLILVAALIRDNFVFTLLYLFAGVAFLGRIWNDKALNAIRFKRTYSRRAFHGEKVPVDLEIENTGILPAIWVRMVDFLPVEISHSTSFRRVFSIRGKEKLNFSFNLSARKRGRYPVGPTQFRAGDIFGLGGMQERESPAEHIIVYPKILTMPNFSVRSQIPIGSMPIHQPIFEDPNRVVGKRAYQVGDSLRRVDWKSTARTGDLQVKIYEPSITIQGAIFLNLNPDGYYHRRWLDATELAVTTAASIANWLIDKRQAVGLATNGVDPSAGGNSPATIAPHKGRVHLMRILETLAMIEISRKTTAQNLLQRDSVHLSWGTTVILITGSMDDAMFDTLIQIRKRGLQVMLILVGTVEGYQNIKSRAYQAGI